GARPASRPGQCRAPGPRRRSAPTPSASSRRPAGSCGLHCSRSRPWPLPAIRLTAPGADRAPGAVKWRLLLERDVELTDDGGCLRGDLRQVLGQGRPPLAVLEHGPQGAVNGGNALGVALLEPYSVDLVAEERADDLELALVLRLGRETGQDRVVGRDGFDLPAQQLVDAVAVAGEPDQVDLGPVQFLDPVARRGSLPGAHLLALEVIGLLDAVVVRAYEDVLVGDVVRPGKRNHLLPFRRDR